MEKKEIVNILEEIGTLLELSGENPFKTRAYSAGARALEARTESLAELIESEELEEIKGIGKALKEKIETLATTGELEYYSNLRAQFPSTLFDLLKVPNLGPKKVKALYSKLEIDSLEKLEAACKEGKLEELDGFGKKTEEKILDGIEHVRKFSERVLYPVAEEAAVPLLELLKKQRGTIRVSLCGSLRRKRETVKDIDIVVSSKKPEPILKAFVEHDSVTSVSGHGETKASVVLENGMNADLRVVSDEEFPFAVHYFTGSKDHNTQMRARAKEYGLKMNEYGYFKEDDTRIGCKDEAEIFSKLELKEIPPELREGRHEIEWAEKDELPELIDYDDLKGTLHCHTTASDGKASLEEMAEAAAELGYEYFGIGDHSKAAFYANGLDEKRLAKQIEEIDAFNKKHKEIRLLKGSEVDILKDGSLDFAEEVLSDLDYAVASVHSIFNLDSETMTKRLIKAIESPGITFLGHMTGRLLQQRDEYVFNMSKVLDATEKNGKWIEINANPHRLDLDWRTCLEIRDRGILFIINPDAHNTQGISDNRYGINVARKAGLTKEHVANTRSLKEFLSLLKK
ncbi:MAG: DNA polymerase/3'-5' exonuclease PolX [Candidatus Omnitrophica bacterium]|nr:DNA polymerase/3'-5' exonuclease PolX [Candidatus Omnitrophota bacterium]MCB9784152.1 DNA polymerase/3'-5' exonuclease PolX [Candidatus Omnitrophota bacterium]